MNATTSAYRFTRHADEYAVTTREGGGILGKVRRVGATWHAEPATIEQGAHLYVTEYHTRHNAAVALDAAHREEARAARVETTGPVEQLAPGMYRVRVTVTNRDGVHTATEDMNPAAIKLARTRPGWAVEILGESRVTTVDDERVPAFVAPTGPARRAIWAAYAVKPGHRIVLDGDTVTVLDVHRDDTARTVTLTTSYGAPRTVTFNAAVPVVFGAPGEEDAPDETGQLDALAEEVDGDPATLTDEEITRRIRLYRHLIAMHPSPWVDGGEEAGRVALLRQRLARLTGEEERRAAPARVETDPRTVTGTPENIGARASARARGELAAQAPLRFDESDRQAMTGAQLRAVGGEALALF